MRTLQIAVLLSVLLAVPGLVMAEKEMPWSRKLPFESLTVHYALDGMETGTEILYIKDHGKKQATYRTTVTSMMGMKMENKSIEIEDGEWIYSYDLNEQTGTKSRHPSVYMTEEFQKLSAEEQRKVLENSEKMGGDIMSGMGGVIEKKAANMHGFDCDRTSVMGTVILNIHDTEVMLKMESNIMGIKMNQVATAVDKGKVDDKMFMPPAGIEAVFDEEADRMVRQMAQNAIAFLKDPETAKAQMPQMPTNEQVNERMQQIPEEDQEMMKQAEQMMQGIKGLFGN